MKDIEDCDPPKEVGDIRDEITSRMDREEQTLAHIPESVLLGPFRIDCSEVRKLLLRNMQWWPRSFWTR